MSELSKLALKMQLATAQRKGEVVAAEWAEFDLVRGWWTIPAHKAKNGNTHRVPLSTLSLEIIQQIQPLSNGSRWLFPSPRGNAPFTPEAINHAMRINQPKDIEHFTPHDLRRTAASHMTALGAPRLVVSKILNHSENSVTAIYDRHSYDKEKKQAAEQWGKQLKSIVSKNTG